MQYGELITRSFTVVWRHPYLWLVALLGGADVGVNSFSSSFRAPSTTSGQGTGALPASDQVGQFVHDNLGILLTAGAAVVLIAVGIFLLSCVTTGGLIRASAEHDADRPFTFGAAWRSGLRTFGSILGLRLLALLLGVAVALVLGVLALLGVLSATAGLTGALAAVIALGVLVVLALIPTAVAFGLVLILAARAIVLEQLSTTAALRRGVALLRRRTGRVLLVWIIQVGLGIAAGIAVAIPTVMLSVIAVVLAVSANVVSGAFAAIVVGSGAGLVVLAVLLVLAALAGSYLSTYWTLAFRRLELDARRAVATWPTAPAAPPPA